MDPERARPGVAICRPGGRGVRLLRQERNGVVERAHGRDFQRKSHVRSSGQEQRLCQRTHALTECRNFADVFKTPGKLRGKTPKTARKRDPLAARAVSASA